MPRDLRIQRIEEPKELVRYAAVAQVERIGRVAGLSQRQIAPLLPRRKDPGAFATALNDPPDDLLRHLDRLFVTLDPTIDRTGGLSALGVRLRKMSTREGLTARIPPMWIRELMAGSPDDEFGVLTQASALVGILLAVPDRASHLCNEYRDEIEKIVGRLILIGASPPTPRNVDALILLGSIAGHDQAFEAVEAGLTRALRELPFGFRVWRAITTIVRLNHDHGGAHRRMREWVREQLADAEGLRETSLYPARSLDLELAIEVPFDWSPNGDDWAGEVLRARATNTDASVRERGTAALGLWERAVNEPRRDRNEVKDYLTGIIDSFRGEALSGDGALGLHWVAETMDQLVSSGHGVSNTWPESGDHCLLVARQAAARLRRENLPTRILEPTMTLVEHAILQNAGVYRRQAVDTLSAGGWGPEASRAFDDILQNSASEPWLRCRAFLAFGFLQERDSYVEYSLSRATIKAAGRLSAQPKPLRGSVSELHAGLFACGDCFGVPSVGDLAGVIRAALDPTVRQLVARSFAEERDTAAPGPEDSRPLRRIVQAIAYFATVTARSGDGSSRQLLTELANHPDPATKQLSDWALKSLFDGKDGERVLPLHAARWP